MFLTAPVIIIKTNKADRKKKEEGGTISKRAKTALFLVVCCILNFSVIHFMNQSKKAAGRKQEAVSTLGDLLAIHVKDRMAVDGSDGESVERPEHQSMKECMVNRTVPNQTLYEDEKFKLDITGCDINDEQCTIHTRFTNHSEYKVTVSVIENSVFLNGALVNSNVEFNLGDAVASGRKENGSIVIPCKEVFYFDTSFEELEFRVSVLNTDRSDWDNITLLRSDPISIYTEPKENKDVEQGLALRDDMKILYESDEIRVVRLGLFERQWIRGTSLPLNSQSFWAVLFENRTQNDVQVNEIKCFVNGIKCPEMETGPVSAKRRHVKSFILDKSPSSDTGSDTSESTLLINQNYWILDEIETASISFTVSYTDEAGAEQEIRLEDEFRFSCSASGESPAEEPAAS